MWIDYAKQQPPDHKLVLVEVSHQIPFSGTTELLYGYKELDRFYLKTLSVPQSIDTKFIVKWQEVKKPVVSGDVVHS